MQRFVFIALLLVVSPVSGQEVVGTRGATLALGKGWKRTASFVDKGKDEFRGGILYFLVVEELPSIHDAPADVDHLVAARLATLRRNATDVEASTPEIRVTPEGWRAHFSALATINRARLAFEVHLVCAKDVAYALSFYCAKGLQARLKKRADRIAPTFALAAKASNTKRFRADLLGRVVSLEADSRLYRPKPQPEPALSLVSACERLGFTIFGVRSDDVGAVLETMSINLASKMRAVERIRAGDATVGPHSGREVAFTVRSSAGEGGALLMAATISPGFVLAAEFLCDGPLEARQARIDALLEGLRIETGAAVLPGIDGDRMGVPALTAAEAALFEELEDVVTLPAVDSLPWCDAKGRLLWSTQSTVFSLDPATGVPRSEFQGAAGVIDDFAMAGGELFVALDGAVVRVKDAQASAVGFDAWSLAAGAEGSLIYCRARDSEVAAWPELPRRVEVRRRHPDGRDERLAELAAEPMRFFEPDAAGALVLIAKPTPPAPATGHAVFRIDILDLATGKAETHSTWLELLNATEAKIGGWVITGTPDGGPRGIYHVPAEGEPRLLVSGGRLIGLDLNAERLLLVSSEILQQQVQGVPLLALPSGKVAELGPPCQPIGLAAFQDVATKALRATKLEVRESALFSEREVAARLCRRASELAIADHALILSPDALQIDRLLEDFSVVGARVAPESRLLLAAMLAECLFGWGARFVAPDDGAVPPFGAGPYYAAHELGVALRPCEFVGLLLDGRLQYETTPWNMNALAGRLWLGADPRSLVRESLGHLRKITEPPLPSRSTEALGRLIAAEPENRALRSLVYARLVTSGRMEDLGKIAEPWARGAHPTDDDRRAWFSSRLATARTPEARKALKRDLRRAVQAAPLSSALYLVLAELHASENTPKALDRARACLQRVIEIEGWSTNRMWATQRLRGLDKR